MTPTSWKQSADTGVHARKRSMMFTDRQQHSKDKRKCLWTGMSQLTSVHRASAVSCKKNRVHYEQLDKILHDNTNELSNMGCLLSK